jgi:hypothetical protein
MSALIKESRLVFVGKVKSLKRSGITTTLTYPTWTGYVFEWLRVQVEVVEPVKGTQKGEVVSVLMLSTRGEGPILNPPGIVGPEVGEHHLHCLLPTDAKGMYAAVTAPFDDSEAILLLNRKLWIDEAQYYKDKNGDVVSFQDQSERNRDLWGLVNGKGWIKPEGAMRLRRKYAAEVAVLPAKDAVIHLRWEKQTSPDGWEFDTPKGGSNPSRQDTAQAPHGPITKRAKQGWWGWWRKRS